MKNVTGLVFLALVAWAAGAVTEERVRYDNYKMYRIKVHSEALYGELKALQKSLNVMSFRDKMRDNGGEVDLVVSPESAPQLDLFLEDNKIQYDVVANNIQELIDAEMPKEKSMFQKPGTVLRNWTDYATYDEINEFIDNAAKQHPGIVTLFTAGQSYEGRPIRGLKISYMKHNKAILLDSNIHAIEWITSAVLTYITNELLNSKDPMIRLLAMSFDWYIIPIVNPDGFIYTHDINRLWRKNRRPNGVCVGIDLNRNFDIHWAPKSDDPCDHMYAGTGPNTEPEVISYSDFIMSFPDDYIKIYLAFHSYGQLVQTPWGDTTDPPPGYDRMLEVANGFCKAAVKRYGSVYVGGSNAVVAYPVTGTGKDFGYGRKNIPISFSIELRDKGQTGFFLPPEQIKPNAEEAFDGFLGLIFAALEAGVFK